MEVSEGGRAVFDGHLAQLLQRYTPSKVVQFAQQAIDRELAKADLSPAGSYQVNQTKLAMLTQMQVLLEKSQTTWGNAKLLDVPNEKGLTLRDMIARTAGELNRAIRDDGRGLVDEVMTPQGMAALLDGSLPPDQAQTLVAGAMQNAVRRGRSPSEVAELGRALSGSFGQGQGIRDSATVDRLVASVPALTDGKPRTADEWRAVWAQTENIPGDMGTKLKMFQGAASNVWDPEIEGRKAFVSKDSPQLQAIIEEAGFLQADILKPGSTAGEIARGKAQQKETTFAVEIQAEAMKVYEKKLAGAVAEKKAITPELVEELAETSTEEAVAKIRKTYLQGEGADGGNRKRLIETISFVQNQLQRTNGQITPDVFPQWMRQKVQQNLGGRAPKAEDLANYFQGFVGNVRGPRKPDGTPGDLIYPRGEANGTPLLKDLQQRAKQGQASRGRAMSGPGAAPQTFNAVSQEVVEESVTVPTAAGPAPTPPPTPGLPPPEVALQRAAIATALVGQVGSTSIPRRGEDPMVAFDPMGAARRVMNSSTTDLLMDLVRGRQQLTPTTPGLPQMKPSAPLPPLPTVIDSDSHPIAISIGISEGTRTPDGGKTDAWYGHADPVAKGRWNIGTYSANAAHFSSPQQADAYWNRRLTTKATEAAKMMRAMGLSPTQTGWHRLMHNILDLEIQAPAANRADGFLGKIEQVIREGLTVEAIAKARADSFRNPKTGKLETGFASYSALLSDQRRRAGTWDYKRRL